MRNFIRVGLLLIGISAFTPTFIAFSQNSDSMKRPEGWQGSWPGDSQGSKPAPQDERVPSGPQSPPSSPGNQVLEIPPHPQSSPEPSQQQAAIPPHSQADIPRPKQLLTVTVTDPQGRYVPGLQADDFFVYENGEQQRLTYFNRGQNEPVSLGFLVDVSLSMINKIDRALFALRELIATVPPRSEVLVGAFAGMPVILQGFTDSRPVLFSTLPAVRQELRRQNRLCHEEDSMRREMGMGIGGGKYCLTALYDALHYGLSHVKKGGLQKEALIAITDGVDNKSSTTLEEVILAAREGGILIYSIGIGDIEQEPSFFGGKSLDVSVLRQTSELTGGRLFLMTEEDVLGNANTLAAATQIISRELSSQYSLGYTPSSPGSDYRNVQVEVRNKNNEKFIVRSQKGYAPDSHENENGEREEPRQVQRIEQW